MLLEPEHAHRVDRARLEAAIDGHDLRLRRNHLGGHAFEECLREAFMHRQASHIERHAAETVIRHAHQVGFFVGRHQHGGCAGKAPHPLPVEPLFDQQQHRLRRSGLVQPTGHVEKLFELLGKVDGSHRTASWKEPRRG